MNEGNIEHRLAVVLPKSFFRQPCDKVQAENDFCYSDFQEFDAAVSQQGLGALSTLPQ